MLEYQEIETEYLTYTTVHGDTWDAIAIDFYGDANLSYILMNANLNFSTYVLLPGGAELKVPIIPDSSASPTLPPWKVV